MSIRDGEPYFEFIQDLVREERWRDLLGEVLAALHRDGGHYQSRYGVAEALVDGIYNYLACIVELDELKERLKELEAIQPENAKLLATTPIKPHHMWNQHLKRPIVLYSESPKICRCWSCGAWREICRLTGVDLEEVPMLPETQLDWLAEQAGWEKAVLGNKWRKLIGADEYEYLYDHPSKSLDRLIADHDAKMQELGLLYLLRRQTIGSPSPWYAEIWGPRFDDRVRFEADTPEAALAEAFYTARGGPQ